MNQMAPFLVVFGVGCVAFLIGLIINQFERKKAETLAQRAYAAGAASVKPITAEMVEQALYTIYHGESPESLDESDSEQLAAALNVAQRGEKL